MGYKHIQVPSEGEKISVNADHSLNVPDNPIIPYIEGDGIGVDISPVMIQVVDAAVLKVALAGAHSGHEGGDVHRPLEAELQRDGDPLPEREPAVGKVKREVREPRVLDALAEANRGRRRPAQTGRQRNWCWMMGVGSVIETISHPLRSTSSTACSRYASPPRA